MDNIKRILGGQVQVVLFYSRYHKTHNSFDKLIEELFIEWYLYYNDEGITLINTDKLDVKDEWFFEIEYDDIVHKEKWYTSLATYFRDNSKLPKFSYNLDSYKRDVKLGNQSNDSFKDLENINPEMPNRSDLIDDEQIESIDLEWINLQLLSDSTDIDYLEWDKIYIYTIDRMDLWITWMSLSKNLWFDTYEVFRSATQINKMNMNKNDVISKLNVWKTIEIRL